MRGHAGFAESLRGFAGPVCFLTFCPSCGLAATIRRYNLRETYHNGGVWPFICGFYVSACVGSRTDGSGRATNSWRVTELVKRGMKTRRSGVFNEWIHAPTGKTSAAGNCNLGRPL